MELTTEQVREISALFGGVVINSGDDLVERLKRNQTIYFPDGIEVILTDDDLWALHQQAEGMGEEYEEYAQRFMEDAFTLLMHGDVRWR